MASLKSTSPAGQNPVLVIDNGTGFTKMGFSGNFTPNYIIPTAIAPNTKPTANLNLDDLDFFIGDEAQKNVYGNYQTYYPMKHGIIQEWDLMEQYWEQCFFKYLRVQPEDHYVMLTEPPMNPPENREQVAEIMFETFNVSGIYIGVQAALALFGSYWAQVLKSKKPKKKKGEEEEGGKALPAQDSVMHGTVVDSGDGVTHVIPVSDGYVISSAIKHIPLAGREITAFIQSFIREREKGIPPEMSLLMAQRIKEKECYCCSDIVKEFEKYDENPNKYITTWEDQYKGKKFSFDVAYEKFLGPELFFNPEIFTGAFSTPLANVVDNCIQSCPIDTRRVLYKNIVLSGGSTMFKNFDKRLQRDLKRIVDARLSFAQTKSKGTLKPQPIECNVIGNDQQRFAVWFGGSFFAMNPQFPTLVKTKEEYDEKGPSIVRHSLMFSTVT